MRQHPQDYKRVRSRIERARNEPKCPVSQGLIGLAFIFTASLMVLWYVSLIVNG